MNTSNFVCFPSDYAIIDVNIIGCIIFDQEKKAFGGIDEYKIFDKKGKFLFQITEKDYLFLKEKIINVLIATCE